MRRVSKQAQHRANMVWCGGKRPHGVSRGALDHRGAIRWLPWPWPVGSMQQPTAGRMLKQQSAAVLFSGGDH